MDYLVQHLGFDYLDGELSFDEFFLDFVHRCFKAFDIDEPNRAILPKFEEVNDIPDTARMVKWHLSQYE